MGERDTTPTIVRLDQPFKTIHHPAATVPAPGPWISSDLNSYLP
jgi:hypothetical protein